jgi:lipopolysaccharide biosynthesis glycosyltransferase
MIKQYNIMTACNDSLAPFVAVELTAIARNLKDAPVDFYLLHSSVSDSNIEMLDSLCKELDEGGQITFHEIKVPDEEIFDELAKYGNGNPKEVYYPLAAHLLLPDNVDRVLYLKAGDTLITEDIAAFYNYGFNCKSLIVTGARYHDVGAGNLVRVYSEDDLGDRENGLPLILRGLFNSGSYILNLEKMRADGRTLADYQFLANTLSDTIGKDKTAIYYGDQGLLSAAFVGDIQYYFFTDIQNVFYMPYNFCLWFYDSYNAIPPYSTPIINFAGVPFKPWQGKYPLHIKRFQPGDDKLIPLSTLKDNQAGYYYLWHEYAIITDMLLKKLGY